MFSRLRMWLVGRAARVAGFAATPRGRTVVRLLGAALALFLLIKFGRGLIKGNDFSVYYAAGEAVLAGEDIFDSQGIEQGRMYIYPPTLAMLIAPLAALPYNVASILWTAGMVAALGYVVWALLAALGASDPAERWLIGGLTVLVASRPLDSEFGNGQVNLFVFAAVVAGALAFVRRRPFRSGIWFALGACLKATPAFLFAYFVLKREWRVLAGGLAGALLFLGVLPAVATGTPDAGPRDTLEWARRVAEPAIASSRMDREPEGRIQRVPKDPDKARRRAHQRAFSPGHSLRAITLRYATRSPINFRDPDNPMYVNVADIDREVAQKIYAGLALLVCLLTALACGFRRSGSRPGRFLLELSVFAAAMLLVSPVSRKAHFVALLLPFACGAALVARGTREDGEAAGARALRWLTVCFALYIASSSPVSGKQGSMYLRGIGFYTVTALLPWAALAWLAWRGGEVPVPAGEEVDPGDGGGS